MMAVRRSLPASAAAFAPIAFAAARRQVTRALVLIVLNLSATFASALEVVHPAPESAGDARFGYYWQLLARALTITESDFGPYVLRPATSAMTEPRALAELASGSGKITVLVHGNVADYEKQLLPVYFPLDKGLLGYRVFLIRSETQARLNPIKGLADLRGHSIGQGSDWADATILRNAGLTVVGGSSYEGLFAMLAAGRFELFSRGVVEIGDELARQRPMHPDLAIEDNLLLYYPLTRYFYVSRSPEGEALARRISTGLERMLADGSFERMFQSFKAPFEKEIGFRNRRLIEIDNPLQTPQTPLNRRELWYDPRRDN
jgi:ABC-type amino acid transport substrate-binding protein